jgi:hypothetical protein
MLERALSLASFVFFKTTKFVMRRLIVLNSRLNRRRAHRWNVFSAEALNLPFPAIMTSGPRWNPHAFIAGAGPFVMKESVSVDVEAAIASAKSWTMVFYSFPKQWTVAHVGALDGPFPSRWRSVALAPGKYSVALRYYHCPDTVQLPEIQADGISVIPGMSVSSSNREFYEILARRRSRFYLCLQYYVFPLLRRKGLASHGFIEREFLPMGNPETLFRYGALDRGEALDIGLAPGLLATHDLYFTLYTRDSFPARWYQIQENRHLTAPAEEDGFYLVRIQKRSPADSRSDGAAIDIRTVRANG